MKSTSILVSKTVPRWRDHQRGSIIVIVSVGMVVLLAMAGLALDGGHMLLNKTRLQNTVDAAVLSAAKSLSQGEDVDTARTDALNTFVLNAAATGNHELAEAYTAQNISVNVEYSDSINPFAADATLTDPAFVRVTVNSFPLPVWLSQVVGFSDKTVRASAVAGESPVLQAEACDIAPIMACGDMSPGAVGSWGYLPGKVEILKLAAGSDPTLGPGNFQIIAAYDTGGASYREVAAGSNEDCISTTDTASPDTQVLSEPGAKVGPTVQGFNMRLGGTSGPLSRTEYPPDAITYSMDPVIEEDKDTGDIIDGFGNILAGVDSDGNIIDPDGNIISGTLYSHADYVADLANGTCPAPGACPSDGIPNRRVLTIPIGRCDGTTSGREYVQIAGFGCFFMLQPVTQKGNESQVYGQFIHECEAEGGFLQNPTGAGTGPTRLILYKDSASGDS